MTGTRFRGMVLLLLSVTTYAAVASFPAATAMGAPLAEPQGGVDLLLLGSGDATIAGELAIGVLPAGWVEQTPLSPAINRYFVLHEKNIVAAEMLLIREDLPQPMHVEDYFRAVQQNSMPSFQGYSPIETRSENVQGANCIVHDFLFRNGEKDLKARMFVAVDGAKGYTFLFDGLESDFARLIPRFDEFMAQSVIFTGKERTETRQEIVEPSPSAAPASQGSAASIDMSAMSQKSASGDEGLPALVDGGEGELPALDQEEPGVFGDVEGHFRIRLPEGSELRASSADAAEYATPEGATIRIFVFAGATEAENFIAAEAGGKRFRGKATLSCGEVRCGTGLYTAKDPVSGALTAFLLATYEKSGAAIEILLPAEKYDSANTWIKAFLCGAEIQ